MNKKINQYLDTIEKAEEIKILLACETGSRAWGFPSLDSDFDIRMIYVHKKDWYVSLYEKKDDMVFMLEDNRIDITGWDLRKSLRLLQKSNLTLIERIQSSILYRANNTFLSHMHKLANSHYSRIAAIHHYLGIAKKFAQELKEKKEYKLKTFFYALRCASACKWVLEKEEPPPIQFQTMLAGLKIESNLFKRIETLIQLKATIREDYFHKGEQELINFIEDCINMANKECHSLPSSTKNGKSLNSFFLNVVTQHDN